MFNAPDTAFMLVATALVLIMTPGLAFFYGCTGPAIFELLKPA